MNDWYEAEQRVEKAQDLFAQQKWEQALIELRAAIAINPHNAAWHFNLGLILDELERYDEAIAAFHESAQLDPDDIEPLQRLSADLAHCGRFHEALIELERMQSMDANFEPSYCQRIAVYAELGEHERAEEMFYLARQIKEECPHCYYNIGCSLAARGLFDKAIYCWQRTLDLDEAYPEVHLRIAEALWEKKQLESARRHFVEEIRRNPGDTATLLDLGNLLMDMGRIDEAGEKFRRAVEHSPDDAAGRFCLGRWMLLGGRGEDARRLFDRALTLDPTFGGAHRYLAELDLARGDRPSAMEHLRAELRLHPEDSTLLLDLANLLIDCDELRPATACLKRLLRLEPDNAAAWQTLGVTHFLRGRHREGIDATLRAVECHSAQTVAMHNLALGYEQLGQHDEALSWARRALERDPADVSLQRIELRIRIARWWSKLTGWLGALWCRL